MPFATSSTLRIGQLISSIWRSRTSEKWTIKTKVSISLVKTLTEELTDLPSALLQ